MRTAAFGIVGIETSLALIYTGLVEKGILTPLQMVEKMCYNPFLKKKPEVSGMARRFAALLLCLVLAVLLIVPAASAEGEKETKVVRVGWYETSFNHKQ